MALDKHEDERLVSLHGRKLGMDYHGYLVGPPAQRHALETVIADGALARSGLSVVDGSTGDAALTVTLAAPDAVGAEKTIISGSTHAHVIARSTEYGACSFYCSTGTEQEGQTITFAASVRCAVQLVAISTDKWAPVSPGSTAYWSVSTST